jgi:hypothetical protein
MNAFCSQCNAPMSCYPGHNCWCCDLPHALPVPDQGATGCLCKDFLTKKLKLHAAPANAIRLTATRYAASPILA